MKSIKENRIRLDLPDMLTIIFIFAMQSHFWLEASELSQYEVVNLFRNICFYIAFANVILKWILKSTISIKRILILITLFVIIFYEANISNGFTVIKLLLFGVAIKDISLKKIIKFITGSNLVILLFVLISLSLNIIENKVKIDSGGEILYCWGFKNPNTTALLICIITFGSVLLYYEKLKIYHLLIIIIESILIYKFLGSRSAVYVLIILAILIFSDKYISYGKKILFSENIKKGIMLLFPIFTLISYMLAKMYSTNVIVKKLNILFSWRFYLWNKYVSNMEINLWGHDFSWEQFGTLDNGYLVILYKYGLIVWLLYAIMFWYVLLMAYNSKNICIIILTIVYEVYILVEGYPIYINANIILLIFFVYFWRNGMRNYD